MKAGAFSNEAKTGTIVLVSIALLIGLMIKIGNFSVFQKGYTVKSRFHFTGGVKRHSPVRLSGVDVGEVKDIRMIYGEETLVEVDLWLRDETKLRMDSQAYVTTLGMMGEKYIEIKAGTPAAEWAKDGDTIPGKDPVRLEELVEVGTKVAGDVSDMAKNIGSLAKHADEAVVGNRPKIDRTFSNLEDTSENFRDFSEDIKWHPWKILVKGREKSRSDVEAERTKRAAARVEAKKQSQNFAPKAGTPSGTKETS